jgi:7-cyano-7-deazaguanine reductase
MNEKFKKVGVLGRKVGIPKHPNKDILEVFPKPKNINVITFETNEFTSLCPVTGQPDFATVTVIYKPNFKCVESKSLKLYLQSFRNEGGFIEDLSSRICCDLQVILNPKGIIVMITSMPRGGLSLKAESALGDI